MVIVTVKVPGHPDLEVDATSIGELQGAVNCLIGEGLLAKGNVVLANAAMPLSSADVFDWKTPDRGQAVPSDTVSQVEYIQAPMVAISWKPGSSSSGTGRDPLQFTFCGWQISNRDRANIKTCLSTVLGSKMINKSLPAPSSPPHWVHETEAQTNIMFLNDACKRINDIYEANEVDLRWVYNPRPVTGHSTIPDFALTSSTSEQVMVGEGKFPSVLDNPRLVQACANVRAKTSKRGEREREAVCCAVEQQCNYMFERGMRYGFLTTHQDTFFIKYDSPGKYAITDAVISTSRQPSIPEMLFYLAEKSREEGTIQVEPGATLVPAMPDSDPIDEANGRGSGPSGARSGAPSSKVPRIDGSGSTAPASTNRNSMKQEMIPYDALLFEERLGEGLCGIVSAGRLFGQRVAIKCVDAYNSSQLIPHLQREVDVLAGRLQNLQGVCVPVLHTCSYWTGGLLFVLATSIIRGRHPRVDQHSAQAAEAAVQGLRSIHAKGVAHGDIREENILIDGDDKVWFIDFGLSTLDPTPEQCDEELSELRHIFAAADSPGSGR